MLEIFSAHAFSEDTGLLILGMDLLGHDRRTKLAEKPMVFTSDMASAGSKLRKAVHMTRHNSEGGLIVFPNGGNCSSRVSKNTHNGSDCIEGCQLRQELTHGLGSGNILSLTGSSR
jgi:hypothetical protein